LSLSAVPTLELADWLSERHSRAVTPMLRIGVAGADADRHGGGGGQEPWPVTPSPGGVGDEVDGERCQSENGKHSTSAELESGGARAADDRNRRRQRRSRS
jgi:hypothetical protein